jgi:hypothetical protein
MSGGDIPIGDFTYPVTADLSAYQFKAVYLNTTTLAACTSGSLAMLGVLQDNPDGSSKATVGSVRELGHTKCWVDASAITAGVALKPTTGGKLALASSPTTESVVAIALEANSSTSCIIEVALTNRILSGGVTRAGHLVFNVPMVNLGTTGAYVAVTAAPFGFVGVVKDMFAVPAKVASTSGATVLTAAIGATPITSLALTCSNASLKVANGTAITGVAATAANSFVATDTLTITSTPSVTFSGDTGTLEIHVITN